MQILSHERKQLIAFIDGRKTKTTQKKFMFRDIKNLHKLQAQLRVEELKNCYIWNVSMIFLSSKLKALPSSLGLLLYTQVFNSLHIGAIILWSEFWARQYFNAAMSSLGRNVLLHAMYGKGDPSCWVILPSAISGNKFDFSKVI